MISVCMATYNGEKYVKNQIISILKQLSDDDELIVSDDLSTDKTVDVVKSINDSRIKIIYNTGKHGYTKNFENALKNAKGDYIFLSDQDDEWVDDKVKKTLEKLKNNNFVVSDCITVDDKNEILDYSRFKTFSIKKGFWKNMVKIRYLGCCMAFDKKVLNTIIPFPKNDKLVEHDAWIALVSEKYFKVELINEPLIYYKRHGNNASDGGNGKGYSLINKMYRRIYRLFWIFKIHNRVKK